MIPDFIRIGEMARAWKRGVLTSDEARERILGAFEPERLIPEDEAYGKQESEMALEGIEAVLRRVELKLDAVIAERKVGLPAEVDPHILCKEVQRLAEKGEKLAAIRLHRLRTGAGLAEAKAAIEEYLWKKGKG